MLLWIVGTLFGSQALLYFAGVATGITIGVIGYYLVMERLENRR